MFIRWMSHLCPALAGQVVAIDGKTVRGPHQRGERAIHLVSVYGSGLGVVLGQVRTADKRNEITAIPELLDARLLKSAIVTIDAMGCQTDIARRLIVDRAGDETVHSLRGGYANRVECRNRKHRAQRRANQCTAGRTGNTAGQHLVEHTS
ncbi:ISAs1 family transposase [Burkholderia pyrrocinia]|uniref:ISAs1 family transposase n=1 Tax=Burkholderia pyrrocinia TaxID=60550 RepID=UPI00201B6D5C|nr:ISAs1 family transposase [Burkholderia pyrrocinia]